MTNTLKVVTPPASKLLTTLEMAKEELGVSDSSKDNRINGLIMQASALIENYTHRVFSRARYSETFHGNRRQGFYLSGNQPGFAGWDGPNFYLATSQQLMQLSVLPVVEIVSANSAEIQFDTSQFHVDDSGRLICFWQPGDLTIVYDAGYIMPGQEGRDLPADLERACLDAIVALWYRASKGDPTIRSESIAGIGNTSRFDPKGDKADMLPPSVTAILSEYQFLNV